MSAQTLPSILPSTARVPAVTFGPFEFDPGRRLLRREGTEIPLPPRVLGVLELLLARAGDVVSRPEIIDAVWKEAFVTDTSLAEAVSFLRQALGDDPQSPTYIQTVHRRGYRFVAPVGEIVPPPSAVVETPVAPAPPETVTPSILNELLPWSAATVALILAISALWYSQRLEPVTPQVVRLTLDAGRGLRYDARAPALAISPSGTRVAWSACGDAGCQLYIRALDQLDTRPVADTDGAAAPFFSPDERWLGFFASGKLKKVALAGGASRIIADASQPFGAVWLRDGRIVYAASVAGGLMRVNQEGGDPEPLTVPSAAGGEIRHVFPASVQDGDALLFTIVTSPLVGAPGRLVLLPYPGRGSWRTVAEAADIGVPIGHEYIAFARGGDVHVVAFDRVRQAPSGPEQTVATGIVSPHIASSAAGAFVAVTAGPALPVEAALPRWSWSDQRAAKLPDGLEDLLDARLSPDGSRIAGVGLDPRPDVWSMDLERGTKTRLTDGGPTAAPVWSADGGEVLYAVRYGESYEIWARAASATGDNRRVFAASGHNVFPASVSRDATLAFVMTGGSTRSGIGLLRAGQSSPALVIDSRFDELAPALSPDGSWLAYQTDESGVWEIVLATLADGRRFPVSSGGGVRPFWSADGATLFFEQNDDLMAVSIAAGMQVVGDIKPFLDLNGTRPAGSHPGRSVLLRRTAGPAASSAVVTLEWITELRAKLGPPTAASPR